MARNVFERSTWQGTRYGRRGRTVLLDQPALIFACPRCEYRMTALTTEGIETIRRTHVRTVHPALVAELAALDTIDRLYRNDGKPRHLRCDGDT